MNGIDPLLGRQGSAWVYGDNVSIDADMMPIEIMRSREENPEVLAEHLMEGIDPSFSKRVRHGDVIIGGAMFGVGKLHGQALLAMRHLGLGVVAESVARGFFRLAVWHGVPVIPSCPGIGDVARSGDPITVDFASGVVTAAAGACTGEALREPVLTFVRHGGERAWLREEMASRIGSAN